ncbi:protein of unknown function [Kyrpidia spormannii]|uniref:Uncharacterized protein n=1 Tax=Kyrpidia spormannii TaxID=2055160 RepID=A0ACA8Z7K1_9BACL|nr:protein of unknown function [Kyrpidia spormannii]
MIDTRRLWKDGEQTRLLPGHTNVVYDEGGAVYCYCPETGARQQMSNGGFEKDRGTLKKVCPAKAYGITCQGREQCPVAGGCGCRSQWTGGSSRRLPGRATNGRRNTSTGRRWRG